MSSWSLLSLCPRPTCLTCPRRLSGRHWAGEWAALKGDPRLHGGAKAAHLTKAGGGDVTGGGGGKGNPPKTCTFFFSRATARAAHRVRSTIRRRKNWQLGTSSRRRIVGKVVEKERKAERSPSSSAIGRRMTRDVIKERLKTYLAWESSGLRERSIPAWWSASSTLLA